MRCGKVTHESISLSLDAGYTLVHLLVGFRISQFPKGRIKESKQQVAVKTPCRHPEAVLEKGKEKTRSYVRCVIEILE